MSASSPFPLQGACFCGTVTFTITSPPILKAYCHCSTCQRLTGCPFIHTIHVPRSAFAWTHHRPPAISDSNPQSTLVLDTYTIPSKTHKTRYRCKTCGTGVASYNAQKATWSVWGALFTRDKEGRLDSRVWEVIKPDAHIFYGTRMLDVHDEVGKWEGYKDVSKRLG